MRLTRNDFEPDILFCKNAKALQFTETSTYSLLAIVLEILSESTAHIDRGLKFNNYELRGMSEYWIIDPEHKPVENMFF